jgi:hypothetical protein
MGAGDSAYGRVRRHRPRRTPVSASPPTHRTEAAWHDAAAAELVIDYAGLRDACESVFRTRRTHGWPPILDVPLHWVEPFARLAGELDLPVSNAQDGAASMLDGRWAVLLGEAGIGKSNAMRQLESILNARASGAVLRLDLGAYGDTSELSADLFDGPVFREWHEGDSHLDLLLDSLDEGIAGVRNIVGLLQRRLRNLPFERLHLYLSCRSTAWSETLTRHLIECFGDEQAGSHYQLVPLLRSDVDLAARAVDIEPERFLREVHEHTRGARNLHAAHARSAPPAPAGRIAGRRRTHHRA